MYKLYIWFFSSYAVIERKHLFTSLRLVPTILYNNKSHRI